jgi:hypothetical protein
MSKSNNVTNINNSTNVTNVNKVTNVPYFGRIVQFLDKHIHHNRPFVIALGEDHMPEGQDFFQSIGKVGLCIDAVSIKSQEKFAIYSECTLEMAPRLRLDRKNNLFYALNYGEMRHGQIAYSTISDRLAQRESKTTTDDEYGEEMKECFAKYNINCVIGILGMLHLPGLKRYFDKQGIPILCMNIASKEMFEGTKYEFDCQIREYREQGRSVPPGLYQVYTYLPEIPPPIEDTKQIYTTGQKVHYICGLPVDSEGLQARATTIYTHFKENDQVKYIGDLSGTMKPGDIGRVQSFNVERNKFVIKFERRIKIPVSKCSNTSAKKGDKVQIIEEAGAVASGAVASGAVASGAVASGAVASGAVASGAVASGANTSPILGLIGLVESYDADKNKYVIIFERDVLIPESMLSSI